MKKHIAEELPARKHAPAAAAVNGDKKEVSGKSPEKRAKQAIYDIRYRARREELPLQQAYSQYMANSNMSQQEKTLVKQKLFGKGGIKTEDFNIGEFASNNVANALYKVFVSGEREEEPIVLTYMEKMETAEHRKYKVRVTDKNGRSYVRYADREKISSLRANPNIESVEMTGYGEPYEGEKKKGELTAKAKAGKSLDPVGQEDKDIDNDGDHDKTDKYLLNRRKVRGDAIEKRKGVSEEFLGEVSEKKPNKNTKIEPMGPGEVNKVIISPEIPGSGKNMSGRLQMAHHEMEGPFITEKATSQAQQKFMGMVLATKRVAKPMSSAVAQAAKGMTEKQARDFAKTKHKGLPVHKEESECGSESKLKKSESDVREIPTKMNLVKNKFRSMGLKMSYEPDGSTLEEGRDEDAQERRFQTRGHRSRGETMTAAIGTAARAKDTLESRRKKVKPESPKGKELSSRSERMGERIKKLQQARQNDTSTFRQGRVGSPKPDN